MAELVKKHHETLQEDGIGRSMSIELDARIEEISKNIPDSQKLPNPENSDLNKMIAESNIDDAIDLVKNGSATGLDGCLYKLWKGLKKQMEAANKEGRRGFDIAKALIILF